MMSHCHSVTCQSRQVSLNVVTLLKEHKRGRGGIIAAQGGPELWNMDSGRGGSAWDPCSRGTSVVVGAGVPPGAITATGKPTTRTEMMNRRQFFKAVSTLGAVAAVDPTFFLPAPFRPTGEAAFNALNDVVVITQRKLIARVRITEEAMRDAYGLPFVDAMAEDFRVTMRDVLRRHELFLSTGDDVPA